MENNLQTKPNLVMAIALMTLINGIFNVIWGIGIIIGTIGLSLLCFPIPLFPIILGGFEITYAIKLLETPPQSVKPSQAIAIWEIAAVFVLNIFSMVVGILVLIFYNDSDVKAYFARLNGTPTPPAPPATPEPAPVVPVVEPTPEAPAPVAPAVESTPEPAAPAVPSEIEVPAVPTAEEPAKPKRRSRKLADK